MENDLDMDEPQGGEFIDIEIEKHDVQDTEDGGAIVTLDDESEVDENPEFYANLAEEIDESNLSELANDLLDAIARDKEARSLRDKQYEEGLKRTGLGNDAPGGAQFQGASKVVHPILTEVSIDFAA